MDAGQVAAAAALAARMASIANNPYDITTPVAPAASSSAYYDIYGGRQPEQDDAAILYAQRARELEFFHLQQQMQERQVIENEARSRLLEHAARNQIQEQMALIAEIQQRDQEARYEVERSRLVNAGAITANALRSSRPDIDADAVQILQDQQLGHYVSSHQDQSLNYKSSNPQQWTGKESSAVPESKADRSPSRTKKSLVKEAAVESPKKKESSPQKKNSSAKKEQPPKKEPSPMKEQSSMKELFTKDDPPVSENVKSPQKNSAPKEEAKVPLDTPSSSHLVNEKKITPAQTKSSPAAKKSKNTPSKTSGAAAAKTAGPKGKQAKKSPGGSVGGGKGTPSPSNLSLLLKRKAGTPSLDETLPGITDAQYENVEALMNVFCKVPFLAEFTRPVILLHPEVRVFVSINLDHIVVENHV